LGRYTDGLFEENGSLKYSRSHLFFNLNMVFTMNLLKIMPIWVHFSHVFLTGAGFPGSNMVLELWSAISAEVK
jgi:hypothetical protein